MQAERFFTDGQKLHQQGKVTEALKQYDRALKISDNHNAARIFRAVALQQVGKSIEALKEAEIAYAGMTKPDLTVLVNYGVIQKNAGDYTKAVFAYEKALEIDPKLKSALANLGTIYMLMGQLSEAEKRFIELTQNFDDAAPWLNLARIAIMRDKIEDAKKYLNKAEDVDSGHADVNILLARLTWMEKDFEKAFKYCIKALQKTPAARDAWATLQVIDPIYYDLSQVEGVLKSLATQKVESVGVLSTAVDLCRKLWIWEPLKSLERALNSSLKSGTDKIPTSGDVFTLLGADISQEAHLTVARKYWEFITQTREKITSKNIKSKNQGEKLNVAFISSDLRGHAIGYLIVGLFESLKKEKIKWFAYSNTFSDDSETRERLKTNFDRFINISKLNDEELAQKIQDDEIDILIDLNQATAKTRVTTMAYRPAPIQIQWLGMPGTLGAGEDIDYIIVDKWIVDEINKNGFDEKLIILERSYQPNDHLRPDLSISKNKSEEGLPEDSIVFGVFNQYYKFSPETLELWGKIFKKVPAAVLWLLEPKSEALRQKVIYQIRKYGISEKRIFFAKEKTQVEHIARLQWLDLVLDTWPYNAHTTCSDALRAGVPVLSYPGRTFASRVAKSILETSQLGEWVATSPETYVDKAIKFASLGRAGINEIKKSVSNTYWKSTIVDNNKFAKIFEHFLLHIHEKYTKGEKLKSFNISNSLEINEIDDDSENKSDDRGNFLKYKEEDFQEAMSFGLESVPDWLLKIRRDGRKSRLENMFLLKNEIFCVNDLPVVLDVGAATFGWDPQLFESFADEGLLKISGFEPDESSYEKLINDGKPNRNYRNLALGDGEIREFYTYSGEHLNSLLRANIETMTWFGYEEIINIEKIERIKTFRLDDIKDIEPISMIKIDTQGSELMILKNAVDTLSKALFVQLETALIPIYEHQPTVFEVGTWMMNQGFVPLFSPKNNKLQYQILGVDADLPRSQVVEMDFIFMKNPSTWDQLNTSELKTLAYLSHIMFRAFDLSTLALSKIDLRDGGNRVQQYLLYHKRAGMDA
jgi:FkbM family methyltransferase